VNWYLCLALPLHPNELECWVSGAQFVTHAHTPEQADQRFRLVAGYGPEVRTLVLLADGFGF